MRTRKLIKFGVIPLAILILCGAFWSLSDSDGQIRIEGNLSTKDVAEISAGVNRLRRPNFSLGNIKNLPAEIKRYYGRRIGTIIGDQVGTRAMIVLAPRNGHPTNVFLFASENCYNATKKPEGWIVQSVRIYE